MDENLDFYNKENYLGSEENLVRVTGMYKDWFLRLRILCNLRTCSTRHL